MFHGERRSPQKANGKLWCKNKVLGDEGDKNVSPVRYTKAKKAVTGRRNHATHSSPYFSGQLGSSQTKNVRLPATGSKTKAVNWLTLVVPHDVKSEINKKQTKMMFKKKKLQHCANNHTKYNIKTNIRTLSLPSIVSKFYWQRDTFILTSI